MLRNERFEGPTDEWIMLNVGGKIFTTTRTTLCANEPNSMLARMFSQHEHCSHSRNPTSSLSEQEDDDETNEVDQDQLEDRQQLESSRSCDNQSTPAKQPAGRVDTSATPLNSHNQQQHNRRPKKHNRRCRSHQHLQHNTISLRPSPRDSQGAYLIDRSPQYFEPILNYLRHGKLIMDHHVNVQGVLEEAKFYGIVSLLPMLELETERWFRKRHHDLIQSQVSYDNQQQVQRLRPYNGELESGEERVNSTQAPRLNRFDVIKALIRTSGQARDLRFQGCDLQRADLSKLDLRFINFRLANLRYCNLRGANLSYANLERADMVGCNLEGAQLIGANLCHTNLENAILRAITTTPLTNSDVNQNNMSVGNNNINMNNNVANNPLAGGQAAMNIFDAGSTQTSGGVCIKLCANFESANLRQTNLEGSQLQDANFRKAILRGSNLQNCDLTRANLCGADLENCDLSGSDLSEANLRKANVKGAQFELEVL